MDTQRRLPPTDFSVGLHLRTHPLCRSDAERGTFIACETRTHCDCENDPGSALFASTRVGAALAYF
jgi:hypothetical protein